MELVLATFAAVFLFIYFVASGLMILLNKPEGIRPPWWDWGMDRPIVKAEPIVKVEPQPREPQPEIEAREIEKESPRAAAPEVAAKPSRPRW